LSMPPPAAPLVRVAARDTPRKYDRRAGGRHAVDPSVVGTTSDDGLRLKLREMGRRASGGAPGMDDLPSLPGVNVLALATRYIDGGRERFIEFVQLAALNRLPVVLSWWGVYRDLTPAERAKVSYDDICAAAQVRPSDFIGAVVACAVEYGQDVGNLVAAVAHPVVVHQAAKSAKRIGGEHGQIALRDRRMLFEHAGFVPTRTGTSVHVHANASANAQAAAVAASEPSVPSFAEDMQRLAAPRYAVHKQIEGDVVDADPVEDLAQEPSADEAQEPSPFADDGM